MATSSARQNKKGRMTTVPVSLHPTTGRQLGGNLIYVVLFCILVALVITLFSGGQELAANMVMSLVFGLVIYGLIVVLSAVLHPATTRQAAIVYAVAVSAGVFLGVPTGAFLLKICCGHTLDWQADYWPLVVFCSVPAVVVTYFFYSLRQRSVARSTIENERIRRKAVEKVALEGKLRMLQAQIEPHFLFNTLSNVISLINTRPNRAKAMLINLTSYLRTSLARTLPEEITLGQEMDMIRAYLDIQKIRMDTRLSFSIDVPEHLAAHPFPPMILQPLVENAVRHGLEPKVKGGDIRIRVWQETSVLKVAVADTGMAVTDFTGNGVGLSNVRERLWLLYGEDGRLVLTENSPCGVCATVEVPVNAH